jgi:hypothetical protein
MTQLEELQKAVCGPHLRVWFSTKVRDVLLFVSDHPETASQVGLIPYGHNSVFVNSKICARFFGIKPNSCNRNFQEHGFRIAGKAEIDQELRDRYPGIFLQTRAWTKRTFAYGLFNGGSSHVEIAHARRCAQAIREGRPAPELIYSSDTDADPLDECGYGAWLDISD